MAQGRRHLDGRHAVEPRGLGPDAWSGLRHRGKMQKSRPVGSKSGYPDSDRGCQQQFVYAAATRIVAGDCGPRSHARGSGGGTATLGLRWKHPPALNCFQPQVSQRINAAASHSAHSSISRRYHQIEMETQYGCGSTPAPRASIPAEHRAGGAVAADEHLGTCRTSLRATMAMKMPSTMSVMNDEHDLQRVVHPVRQLWETIRRRARRGRTASHHHQRGGQRDLREADGQQHPLVGLERRVRHAAQRPRGEQRA